MTQWRHGLAKGRACRVAPINPRFAQWGRRRGNLAHDHLRRAPAYRGPIPAENQSTETQKSKRAKAAQH